MFSRNAFSAPSSFPEANSHWLSAHLFVLADPPQLVPGLMDRVVREILAPLVSTFEQERWFFIRYQELGPHLRVRIEGSPEVLEEQIKPALEQAVGCDRAPQIDATGSLFPCSHDALLHLRYFPYIPEVTRYGGSAGVDAAEDIFHAASQLVVKLLSKDELDKEPLDPGTRAAQALLLMVVLLHALASDCSHAAVLAKSYSQGMGNLTSLNNLRSQVLEDSTLEAAYNASFKRQAPNLLPQVKQLWQALSDEAEALPEAFATFHSHLGRARLNLASLHRAGRLLCPEIEWHTALDTLVPSYLHMNNNRLGIMPSEESYLGYLVCQLLMDIDAPTHHNKPSQRSRKRP